ncbi:methyltransferase [Marinospirillum insulare]|uniref:Ribosomal RNA small subunit methyltransferase C n=1 Tax=Marinospirillum insulare TaxID=217169 RepID=A0ABQ5ZYN1_9GAMM|nr:methyltransferase [Marinospirillum insulare]GLR64601.1 ribosomal RNA small subunit methyltransferase C [Marinospirillum insulare]
MPNLSSSSPLNQFLFRQLANWLDQPLNLLAAPADLNWQELATTFTTAQQSIQVWTSDWRSFQLAQAAGIQSYFTAEQAPTQLAGRSLVFWPKAKEEGYWWLKQLAQLPHNQVLLIGETNGGVKALAKQLLTAGVQVNKLDSARRCALYSVNSLTPAKHLISENTPHHQWSGPNELTLISQPGVFSHGRVDDGSALLLETLAKQPLVSSGNLLDLGCGCGLLGAWLIKQHPKLQLTACDVSGFALNATRATLKANQLQGKVLAADIFSGLEAEAPPQGYDLIVSNPPFHTGKATDYELASRLISQAPKYLRKGGELWLVANRFLPYPDLLQQAFGNFIIAAENGKFRVYKAIGGKG